MFYVGQKFGPSVDLFFPSHYHCMDPSIANANGEDFMVSTKPALKYGEGDPLIMHVVLVLADP